MNNLTKAIEVLNTGGIVIFPTDTAFGIGCRLDREESIRRLFAIRQRPISQAISLLVESIDMALRYWTTPLPHVVRRLIETYWPGGLTIVYECKIDATPLLVRGNSTTLGVRQPDHAVTLGLIKGVGVPILGPSANFHGQPTPYHFADLDPALVKLVDYVMPGECKTRQASTVVDCTISPPKILRQGSVNIKL